MINRRSVKAKGYWLWIISYIIVLCFPLAFTQILYSASSSVIESNIQALDEAALMRTEESVERVFIGLRSLWRELQMNNQVNSLLYAQLPLTPTKLEKVGQLRSDIQAKVSQNNMIGDIYIYFANPQIVASTKEYYGKPEGFDRALRDSFGITLDTFTGMIAESGDFAVRMITGDGRPDRLIALMTNTYAGARPDVACMISLQVDRFRQVLAGQAGQPETSYVWMVSADGILAATPEMVLADGARFTPQALLSAYEGGTLDSRLVVTRVEGALTGWTLYSAASAEQSNASLRQVQQLYLVYFVVCLAVGLVFSVVFARTNYRPIRRISQMLRISPDTRASSEFTALEHALVDLLRREQESASQLRQQQRQLRQSALTRMLLGRVDDPQVFETLCADSGMHFTSQRFLFVGILIRDSGDFIVPEDAGQQDEGERDEALLQFMVSSVTEELLQASADAYAFEWDDQLYCLLAPRHGEDAETFEQAVRALCVKAEQFIHERTAIRVTYFVGGLYDGDGDPIEALQGASRSVRWGMEQVEGFQLEDAVLTREQMAGKNTALHDAADAYQAKERRAQYVRAVLMGDMAQADALFERLRFGGPFPPECAFANVQFSAALLLSELVEEALTPAQIGQHKEALTALLAAIRGARDAEELDARMHAAAVDVRHMAGIGAAPDADDIMYMAVQAYIAENYRDPCLSVASLCDHFDVSSSYLLKLFKRSGKSGVLGSIQQARIDAAKQLLRGTDMTVAQIAEAVGYANALTLIRAFKRTEGVTPTSYRNIVNP